MVFNWILEKIAGTYNERQLKKYAPKIDKINELYKKYDKFSDEEIKQKSQEFRQRLKSGETLDDILPEAFVIHKQACKRLVGTEYEVKGQKVTCQNFLKLYKKLTGMTGTAATEGEEFEKIYRLEVLVIPTNKPVIRVDKQDKVFFDQDIKYKNVVETVKFYHKIGVPFGLGTSLVQASEKLSGYLRKADLQHSVLNAKYHEMEAKIITDARLYSIFLL